MTTTTSTHTALTAPGLPGWLHSATAFYIGTTAAMHVILWVLSPHPAATALLSLGIIGGYLEHAVPYAPRLQVSRRTEQWLFQMPAAVATGWIFFSLGPAWYWKAIFAVFVTGFVFAPTIQGTEERTHAAHVVFHVVATGSAFLMLAVDQVWWPALNAILIP